MAGSRLTVQFARGSRQRDFPAPDRIHPRPRRTAYRMQISGLPGDTSWQVSISLNFLHSWAGSLAFPRAACWAFISRTLDGLPTHLSPSAIGFLSHLDGVNFGNNFLACYRWPGLPNLKYTWLGFALFSALPAYALSTVLLNQTVSGATVAQYIISGFSGNGKHYQGLGVFLSTS